MRLLVLAALLFSTAAAETVCVTTPKELRSALADYGIDAVEIMADMTVTDTYLLQTKDVTISSEGVFMPSPDDGFLSRDGKSLRA